MPTEETAKATAIAETKQEAEQAVVSETAVITATVELQKLTQQTTSTATSVGDLSNSDEVHSIHYDEPVEGEITIVGQQDYFDFEGERGDLLTILVEFPGIEYLLLYLVGPNGPIAACDQPQPFFCKFERLELPDTGVYRITVDGYENITTNYTLSIAKLSAMNPR